MASRPTKRQRREQPITPLDHESVACVASPTGPISNPVVSTLDKEIILERLKKELVQPFELKLSVPRGNKITTTGSSAAATEKKKKSPRKKPAKSLKRRLVESRLCIGINQCTRALERSDDALVLLCRDVNPPTMVSHIPRLVAKNEHVSLLILPGGHVSLELGACLGVKRASIVVIVQRPDDTVEGEGDAETINNYHDRIDSFVEFVKSKQAVQHKQPCPG